MNKITQSNIFSPVIHRYSLAFSEIDEKSPVILDVGGYSERKTIADRFFINSAYTSVNIGNAWYSNVSADYIYDGINLPFANNSFSYVISVDVLEHIPLNNRYQVLGEIVRVASKKAIVVTPFQLPDTVSDERYILDICEKNGVTPPPSLIEHERFGLPLLPEITEYVSKLGGRYKYATDRKDYWSLQTAMLWNTIALDGNSELVNRKLQQFQESLLRIESAPIDSQSAYRCVLVFGK